MGTPFTIRPDWGCAVNAVVINDGLRRLGAVVEIAGGQWEASDADGGALGDFPNQRAATDTVFAARRA